MLNRKQLSGIKGENHAVNFLKKHGYQIIERNFRSRAGEIDIIALESQTLVFIEVKARSTSEFGSPLDAITPWKLNSIIRTAEFYKLKHPKLPDSLRVDAVAIIIDQNNEIKSIELVKNISM